MRQMKKFIYESEEYMKNAQEKIAKSQFHIQTCSKALINLFVRTINQWPNTSDQIIFNGHQIQNFFKRKIREINPRHFQ